jgi:putative ABC transport system ATP-binding protein
MIYAACLQPNAEPRRGLRMLGMGDRTHHRPNELSEGSSNAAIAALAGSPAVILADEPTGALIPRPATKLSVP